jgi:hypothetical protein
MQDPETPLIEWRFARLDGSAPPFVLRFPVPYSLFPRFGSCQSSRFAVVSNLPIKRLMRATRCLGRASSPPSQQIRRPVHFLFKLRAAGAHIGRAIAEKSTRRRASFLHGG